MKFQKKIINIFATLFLLNLVHAKESIKTNQSEKIVLIPGPITGKYNINDLEEIYDESSIKIQCTGTLCNSISDNVLLDEGKVTISNSGTYILSGELNGQLNIAAKSEDIIHLILRNLTISSDFGPAVNGEKCKKVIITTEGQNTISDSINYPEASTFTTNEEVEKIENDGNETQSKLPNACIFIKSNITFNGKGSLNVTGNFDEGIRSKKNIKLVSGKINVVSKGNGIKAKESISIKEAEINIDSGKSAIKVTKDTDPEEGFVVVDGGKITIKAVNDAIHTETHLTVNDGFIKVIDCEEGLEGQMIDIIGGEIYIDAVNDGINVSKIKPKNDTNESVEDDVVSQSDYDINEQIYLRITGGKVDIRVEGPDLDGIDSNGSIYIGDNSEVYVRAVYGGAFGHIAAVDSDGFKSIHENSIVFITGSGNFPSDTPVSENGIKGTLGLGDITVENVLNMYPEKTIEEAENIVELMKSLGASGKKFWYDEPETCTYLQPYVRITTDIQLEGTSVIIKDSKGKVIIEHKPRTQFGIIFFSSPEIIEDETYTITVGDYITETVIAKVDKDLKATDNN